MAQLKKTLGLVIILAAVAVGWSFLQNGGAEKPSYRTEKITRDNISAVVSATGTLNPIQLITVGSQVSGKVNKLYVKVNDRVKTGQMLAEIDPSLLEAQIKQDKSALEIAKISYEQAQRDLNRTRMLLAKDFVAKVDLEHAEQSYQQAKNSYDSAQTVIERDEVNLNYAKITAPIDGIVIAQTVTEGQTLQSSFQSPDLFKIAGNLTEMKIDVNFPESDITRIKVDQPVTFTVNAFPGRIFAGKVQTVNLSPTAGQGGVTYSVTIELKNDDGSLLPGMTAYASVILSQQKDVLRLPLSALRFNPPPEQAMGLRGMFGSKTNDSIPPATDGSAGTKNIYVLRNGVLTPLHVTTGASDDTYIEVSGGGIAEGDEVVVGMQKTRKK